MRQNLGISFIKKKDWYVLNNVRLRHSFSSLSSFIFSSK